MGAIVHFGHSEQHGYKFVQQMPEREDQISNVQTPDSGCSCVSCVNREEPM